MLDCLCFLEVNLRQAVLLEFLRVADELSPLECTVTKKGGVRLLLTRFPLAAGMLLLLLPIEPSQQKASSSNDAPPIEVIESPEELHEMLQEKAVLTFGAPRTPSLTIT